ncbi:hypothetical protein ACOMHN_007344 [Nucella lapillus]
METYNIREATVDDCEDIMRMIVELAEFEKMARFVKINAKDLKRDAFGQNPLFYAYVAEAVTTKGSDDEGRRPLVGYVMYYYTYSPWFGRTCTMEDFYVAEGWRKKGIGTALWAKVTQIALSTGCYYVSWIVLDWNQQTIDFYKRRGARDLSKEEGWLQFRMEKDDMTKFVAQTFPSDINHKME